MKYTPKELRARKGESQQKTANALGVSKQTYCAWEKESRKSTDRESGGIVPAFSDLAF